MRYALPLLLVPVLLSAGCSQIIERSGEKLSIVTRQDLVTKFGPPTAEGVTDGGRPYQEFRSRRKYAEENRAQTERWGLAFTYGLAELYLFPRELWFAAKRSLFGEKVRVTYDRDGSIYTITTHGYSLDGGWERNEGVLSHPGTATTHPDPLPPDALMPTVQKLLNSERTPPHP